VAQLDYVDAAQLPRTAGRSEPPQRHVVIGRDIAGQGLVVAEQGKDFAPTKKPLAPMLLSSS
jgi:hypothetical protein